MALNPFIAFTQVLFGIEPFFGLSFLSAVARTGYMEYKGFSYKSLDWSFT